MVTPSALCTLSRSLTPRLAQVTARSVSSVPVSSPPVAVGASFTGTTLTVVVATLEVLTPSVTVTVMIRGVVLGSSLVLMNVMFFRR